MAAARFAELVQEGMDKRGLSLRELCRRARLDPSFLSKVLSGKRAPPHEEAVLRRIAKALELEPASLEVAAGRIPSEWSRLAEDPGLFDEVRRVVLGGRRASWGAGPAQAAPRRGDFSEELL